MTCSKSADATGRVNQVEIKWVLDASAVLAYLNQEPRGQRLEDMLAEAAISTVNVSEAIAVLIRRGMDAAAARDCLASLRADIVAFDNDLAFDAAILKERNRANGLSLGDCACLATAEWLRATAVTCDSAWEGLSGEVNVVVLR